ncbi:hypothetical protein ONA70_03100 [Micromonospora yasonensis]|uniref:hypothetical protein n=1 Tax=Micromonospora yasonensis TaxID=1128667 RepID=UPI00222F8AF2|nr:hypothetical protein [Micromonospora yasonensis]MCW3839083.1 hypothetical protein [Micromonospora yasonensis]
MVRKIFAGAVLAAVPVVYISVVVLYRTPLADELNSLASGPVDEFAPLIFMGGMLASVVAFGWLMRSGNS